VTDIHLPAWAVALLGPGLPAAGWLVGRLIDRRWRHADRRLGLVEANLTEQLKLLRELNGDVYQKWLWLADHPHAADLARAEPAANEIGTWLYKHSAYFPERVRVTMVNLGDATFLLATERRANMLAIRPVLGDIWMLLRDQQRKVERRLGLE
jgi:hypothetical protein